MNEMKNDNGADKSSEVRHNGGMKLLWDVKETSKFLGVGTSTVYKLMNKGYIKPVELSGISRTLFKPADIITYVESLGERSWS